MPPGLLLAGAMEESSLVCANLKKRANRASVPNVRWADTVEWRPLILNERIEAILIWHGKVSCLVQRARSVKRRFNHPTPVLKEPAISLYVPAQEAGIVISVGK
jgi:hypothetical protein